MTENHTGVWSLYSVASNILRKVPCLDGVSDAARDEIKIALAEYLRDRDFENSKAESSDAKLLEDIVKDIEHLNKKLDLLQNKPEKPLEARLHQHLRWANERGRQPPLPTLHMRVRRWQKPVAKVGGKTRIQYFVQPVAPGEPDDEGIELAPQPYVTARSWLDQLHAAASALASKLRRASQHSGRGAPASVARRLAAERLAEIWERVGSEALSPITPIEFLIELNAALPKSQRLTSADDSRRSFSKLLKISGK